MNVLIVDDNSTILTIHKQLVEELGHTVIGTAINGTEGLELYKELVPDLVITDIDMPSMDGIELTREIMAFDAMAKVIIVSSFELEDSLVRAVSSECVDYVHKPIEKEDLEAVIAKIS